MALYTSMSPPFIVIYKVTTSLAFVFGVVLVRISVSAAATAYIVLTSMWIYFCLKVFVCSLTLSIDEAASCRAFIFDVMLVHT